MHEQQRSVRERILLCTKINKATNEKEEWGKRWGGVEGGGEWGLVKGRAVFDILFKERVSSQGKIPLSIPFSGIGKKSL